MRGDQIKRDRVTFLGNPLVELTDSQGQDLAISARDEHITSYPKAPNAVPHGKVVKVSIRPCLSGPFVPTEGYEVASPAYLISRLPLLSRMLS